MYGAIFTLLGLLLMVMTVAIIKPSLFHRFYKNLKRKHAVIAFLVVVVLLNITPAGQKLNEGVELEQQAAADAQVARDAAKAAAEAEERQQDAATLAVLNKITLKSSIKENSIGTPELYVTIYNGTDKTIDAIELEAYFKNNFDEPVGEWDRRVEEAFGGEAQETIAPGASRTIHWNLTLYESATKVSSIELTRVHFTDGADLRRP